LFIGQQTSVLCWVQKSNFPEWRVWA